MWLFVLLQGPALLVHLASVWGSPVESPHSNAVYGLPELTRDILERIKAATGQPIDTHRFVPIPSTKNYQVLEYQPLTRKHWYVKKSGNANLEKGRYSLNEKEKNSGLEKDHFFDIFEQDSAGNEVAKNEYGDEVGESHKYNEEKHSKKDWHESGGGQKGGRLKKGRKRGKFHVEKGFRDIYHKDEEKKSDFYWNNQHEEGKWIEYGFKKRKKEKSEDKGDEGKQQKDKKEESSYERKENKCTKCKS